MEVVKGIYQIQSETPFRYSMNTYFIDDNKKCLIDTSVESYPQTLLAGLEKIGRHLTDLDYVLVSHPHSEHIGSLNYIKQAAPHCQIVASPRCADYLANYEQYTQIAFQRISSKIDRHLEVLLSIKSVKVDKIVKEGDVINLGSRKLKVFETSGHCAEEISFYCEKSKILFSSDFIIGTEGETWQAIYIGMLDYDGSRRKYLASLQKIVQLKERIRLILPAHGAIIKNPKEKIEGLLRIAPQIEESILKMLEAGPKTFQDLIELAHGKKFQEPEKFYAASRRMQVLLDYLLEEKRILKKHHLYFKIEAETE